MIRSAAFLNLKAGQIEAAQKFIFFGLLNIKDEIIKTQLYDALEFAISLKNIESKGASLQYNYLSLLRQRSTHYVLEPSSSAFGNSVSLEMIKEFTEDYLKSLKAYGISIFRTIIDVGKEIEDSIDNLINPLVTSTAYGSFKFSIANDFLARSGEKKEVLKLKSNIIRNYHREIFTNPLTDENIKDIKARYDEEDINRIFRPLTKIKANNSPYKVGYYDSESFKKVFVNSIINKQRVQLLTVRQIPQEDIGELENSIIHKRSSLTGKVSKKVIFKEQLKSYKSEIKTNLIVPEGFPTIMLIEDILINMNFNSDKGFTFSFYDLSIEYTDIESDKALKGFQNSFYKKAVSLASKSELNNNELKEWEVLAKLINDPHSLNKT